MNAEPPSEIARRWEALLAEVRGAGAGQVAFLPAAVPPGAAASDEQVFLDDLRISPAAARRRGEDLLILAFLTRGAQEAEELVVVPAETVLLHSGQGAGGSRVSGLRLAAAGTGLRSVSLVVFRAERIPSVRDLVGSLVSLAESMDLAADPAGTQAVATAVLRRARTLAGAPGVTVPLAGTARPSTDSVVPATPEPRPRGFLGEPGERGRPPHEDPPSRGPADTAADTAADAEAEAAAAPAEKVSHARLRLGPPRDRRTIDAGSLGELRRHHVLAALSRPLNPPQPVPGAQETWTGQAARLRQVIRARDIVARATGGEPEQAAEAFLAALREPAAETLMEALLRRLDTPAACWLLDVPLEIARTRARGEMEVAETRKARHRLLLWLGELMGLDRPESHAPADFPPVTPVVVEVSDSLVPYVKESEDGGLFLRGLIPAMKDRIRAGFGIEMPGVLMRGNTTLSPGYFQVQIDEVPVLDGRLLHGKNYVIRRPGDMPAEEEGQELTTFHPRTGEFGVWLLAPADPVPGLPGNGGQQHEGAAGEDRLTTAQYLIHRIEMVMRHHLRRFLGPLEVAGLIAEWSVDDEELVRQVVPDGRAMLRLTWVLQILAEELVPLTDRRALLDALRRAGGTDEPVPALVRAARGALREHLPGPRDLARVIIVPQECEDALAGEAVARPDRMAPIDVVQWLRRIVDRFGPVLSLVAHSHVTRERLAVLARMEHPFLATFTTDEMGLDP